MMSPETKLVETEPSSGVMWKLAWGFFWRGFLCMLPMVFLEIHYGQHALYMVQYSGNPSVANDLNTTKKLFSFLSSAYSIAVVWGCLYWMSGQTFAGLRLVFLFPPPGIPPIVLKPGFKVMLGLWWAFTWRSILWGLLCYLIIFVLALPLGFLLSALNLGTVMIIVLMTVGFLLAAIFLGLFIPRKVFPGLIGKKFNEHRLVLLTPEAGSIEELTSVGQPSQFSDNPPSPPPSSGTL